MITWHERHHEERREREGVADDEGERDDDAEARLVAALGGDVVGLV